MIATDSPVKIIETLDLAAIPPGTVANYWMHLVSDGMGLPVYIPLIIAKGVEEGPVVGIIAAVRGDEINGLPIIQQLFTQLNPGKMRGVLVAAPVANALSFVRNERFFVEGTDLNRAMPGNPKGNTGEIYAHRLVERLIKHCDYLLDMHTALRGHIATYYVRANLEQPILAELGGLLNGIVLMHLPPPKGSLRYAATQLGIPALTLEVGNAGIFQQSFIEPCLRGLKNFLIKVGIQRGQILNNPNETIICRHAQWLYTDKGGILVVPPRLLERIREGQVVASLRNIFGDELKHYRAPEGGIVVSKNVNPVNQTGGRIMLIGA